MTNTISFRGFKPVFNYNNYYKFDSNDPTRVYSMKLKRFISVQNNTDNHLFFHSEIAGGIKKNIYIHNMVWESYNKKQVPENYVVHHLNFWGIKQLDNRIDNLILLPRKVHKQFHNYYRMYKGTDKHHKTKLNIQDMIKIINNFDIDVKSKLSLISTL